MEGHLLSVPASAIPHRQRAATLQAHLKEAHFDKTQSSDQLWRHERDMWVEEDEPEQPRISDATAHSFVRFLPAGLQQAPMTSWESGRALVDEFCTEGCCDVSRTSVEHAATAHGLSLDEVGSICVMLVEESLDGLVTCAEGHIDVALQLLAVIAE